MRRYDQEPASKKGGFFGKIFFAIFFMAIGFGGAYLMALKWEDPRNPFRIEAKKVEPAEEAPLEEEGASEDETPSEETQEAEEAPEEPGE